MANKVVYTGSGKKKRDKDGRLIDYDEPENEAKPQEPETPGMQEPEAPKVQEPEAQSRKQEQTWQPDSVTVEQTEEGAKVKIGPTNRPLDQDAQFMQTQRVHLRNTERRVKKTGEIGYLPTELEQHRDMLQQKNDSGELIPSSVHSWAVNQVSFNTGSIKDETQLAYVATVVDSEKDKLALIKRWAKDHNKGYQQTLYTVESMLGDRLFSSPKTDRYKGDLSMAELGGGYLYDKDGNAVNINTASPYTVEQAIGGIADESLRKRMADAFSMLCGLRGSRFYGHTPGDGFGTFRDSASLTQSDYNAKLKEYKALFYQGSGYDQQNAEAYNNALEDIEGNDNLDALSKINLKYALEQAYRSVTYADRMPERPQPQQEEATEPEKPEEQPGFLEKTWNGIVNFFNPDKPEKTDTPTPTPSMTADAMPTNTPTPTPTPTPDQEEEPETDTEEVTDEEEEEEAPFYYAADGGDGGYEQTPAPQAEITMPDAPEIQGPAVPEGFVPQNVQETEPVQLETMSDAFELLMAGYGYKLNKADQDYLFELYKSPGVRALWGMMDNDLYKQAGLGLEPEEYLKERNLYKLGTTIFNATMDVNSRSFPDELKNASMLLLSEIARNAEQAVSCGDLVPDEWSNLYEDYLNLYPQERAKVEGIYTQWNLLEKEKADRIAEEEARGRQALQDARDAVSGGVYSDEQYQMVLENADVSADDINRTMMEHPLGRQFEYIDSPYLAPGGGFEQSSIKLRLDASGVTDDLDFRMALKDSMNAVYYEDARMAAALGMSLSAYYKRMGGMTVDQLAQRANARMLAQAASITDEEKAELDAPYGEGVGAGEVFLKGVDRGFTSWQLGLADSLYIGKNALTVQRTAAHMQAYYQNNFGIFGRDYFRRDLQGLIDSGNLDPSYAGALQKALDSAADVYEVGIDPRDIGGKLSEAGDMRRRIAKLDTTMRTNGTKAENFWYGFTANTVSNFAMYGTSAAASTVLGPVAGFTIGYGLPSYSGNVYARLEQGYSIESAQALGAWDDAAMILANLATFGKQLGQMTGASSLAKAGGMMAAKSNPSAMVRLAAAAKQFGRTLAGNVADEAIKDPIKEGMGQRFIDSWLAPMYRKADAGEDAKASDLVIGLARALSPKQQIANAAGVLMDTVRGAPMEAVMSLPLAILGAGAETFTSYKKAKDLLDGKTAGPEAIADLADAVAEDSNDPAFAEAIDEAAKENQIAEKTVQEVLADEEGAARVGKLNEQADSHRQEAEASAVRIEEGWKHYDEQKAEGNMQAAVDALEDISKAEQGLKEHAREQAQKEQEAQQAGAQRMQEARQNAAAKVFTELNARREAIKADVQARAQRLRDEAVQWLDYAEDLNKQAQDAFAQGVDMDTLERMTDDAGNAYVEYENLTEQANAMLAGGQEEADTAVDAQDGAETAQMDGMTDTAYQPGERAQQARAQAQQAVDNAEADAMAQVQRDEERRRVQDELDGMKAAMRELTGRSAKKIYLDAQQTAEVLAKTGLRTLSQVNTQYGTKFRKTKGKDTVALDGKLYEDLVSVSGAALDRGSTHPEVDVMDFLDRHASLKDQLAGMQASVSADSKMAEPYLNESVSRGNLDPITQKLASVLKKHTGLEMIVMPLANNIRGLYDRANSRLIFSTRLGSGEMMRQVVMHELTHFIENSKAYSAYEDAVLEAAYRGNEDALERDAQEIRTLYEESGVSVGTGDVHKELVAAATEKLVGALGAWGKTGSEQIIYDLIGERLGVIPRLYMKLSQFLARRKAKKNGQYALEGYNALVTARDNLKAAIREAGKAGSTDTAGQDVTIELDSAKRGRGQMQTDSEQTEMQYSLVGRTDDGKGIYESNYAPDTPRSVKVGRFIDLWQNVWSKSPIDLEVIGEDGNGRKITASFDPDFDPENQRMTDLGKVIHSKNGSAGDRTITLNLADDLHDMARDVKHVVSERERGKLSLTHKDVKQWHYFSNDFVYRDSDGDKPMTLWLDLKERDDGGWVYQMYAKKTKKKDDVTDPRTVAGGRSITTPSPDTRIQQNQTGVNPNSTQNGPQYALAPRQFNNENAQRTDALTDEVKELLRGEGSEYETVVNRELVENANREIDSSGAEGMADELVDKRVWTPQDTARAMVALVRASRDGDLTTAAMIGMEIGRRGTSLGQNLQLYRILKAMTPDGAIGSMVRKAAKANRSMGVSDGDIPVGNNPPVKTRKGGETDKSGFTADRMPEKLKGAYDKAWTIHTALSGLPQDISYDNPWKLPLNPAQMGLIQEYGLKGTKLPGDNYHAASLKQRMLAAIIATPNNVRGDGMLTLCQQLEAMKAGYAVVTEADLNYINGQASTLLYAEGDFTGMPKTTEGKIALQRMYDAQSNTVQASLGEKANALGYNNMLSSMKTWSKNIASNMMIRPLELASEKIGGTVEKAFVTPKTGNRTTDAPNRAERKAGKAAFTREIGQTMVDYFITHVDTGHGSKFDLRRGGRTFNSEVLNAYKTIVDFAMQIGDRPFWEQCYAEELAVVQRLGMKIRTENEHGRIGMRDMTMEEMENEAAVRATERVFQEDNQIVAGISAMRQKSPILDLALTTFMPFLKTPTNVGMRMMQYSPVGLMYSIVRYGLWDGKKNNGVNFDQRKFVMNLGRGLTGTGLAAVGFFLAGSGMIQPGYQDEKDKDRRAMRKANGESYSTYIKLGDMEIPLDFAQPACGPLYIGAKVAWALSEMDEDVDALSLGWTAICASGAETWDQLFNSSFLKGFSDVFRGYNDADGIATNLMTGMAENLMSRMTPSAVRALAKMTDPYVRDTGSQDAIHQLFNEQIVQNLPILRQTLPVKTDITGNKVLQNGYWNWGKEQQNAALHMMNTFAFPFSAIGEKRDEALDALLDLSYRTGEAGFLPGAMLADNAYELNVNKTTAEKLGLGKEAVVLSLTDEEKRDINREYGTLLFDGDGGRKYNNAKGYTHSFPGLRDVMQDKARYKGLGEYEQTKKWSKMDDDERMKLVEQMAKDAKTLIVIDTAKSKRKAGEI